ncbi:MAG: U32 family peptidase [Candidatus Omnitrophica bacterium]|nr:U32 family peptidase [Candidatus Omnitrophota bacterium]MBU1869951.1 U32 family peptidase [Candidatus Omnitrophota bacterium]
MLLSVPTNWQQDLIPRLNKSKVSDIYGKLDKDVVGGGRPWFGVPFVSRKTVSMQVALAHKNNIKFNYLLNSVCLGNIEYTASGQKAIRKFLDWLSTIGVDSVTVAVPYLLGVIKKCYPNLTVRISLCADVSNPLQARYWEDLGADEITLSPWLVNRNFDILNRIRQSVKCGLQIYANTSCIAACPFHFSHNSSANHASRENDANMHIFLDYYKSHCLYAKIKEPWRILSSPWVRPEDLHYYRELGINKIKLADRSTKTDILLNYVEAYTNERYSGNLMNLLAGNPQYKLASIRSGLWLKLALGFNPRKTKPLLLLKYLALSKKETKEYLDNNKLDGFLDFFVQGKCKQFDCYTCGYCQEFAKKALIIPEDYRLNMKNAAEMLFEDFHSGRLFIKK